MARRLRPGPLVRSAAFVALLVLLAVAANGGTPARKSPPIVVVAANESFNWSGYQQGALEKGTTFHSVAADWIVPRAKPHLAGEDEFSSSWIGVGGGCLDTSCLLSDDTLIQAGIEQDIHADGTAEYYAWWETIPAPLIRTELPVAPGDLVHVDISESVATPGVWTIAIADRTNGGVFSITLPYTSSYGTVEWVIETPVAITESSISVGPMPDLTTVRFDNATANGSRVHLVPAEQVELVNLDLTVIARPSLPDRDANGFNDCTYKRQCPAPGSDLH